MPKPVAGMSGLFFVAAILCAMACTAASAAEPAVVVTSKPIHALVSRVLEGIATPRLLVDGAASPHTYALRPSDAKAAASAGVVFRVSADLEPFTAKLVASLPKSVTVVSLTNAPGLTRLESRKGGTFEKAPHGTKGHSHGQAHDTPAGPAIDPHVWLDAVNAGHMVSEIARTLSQRYPEHKPRFEANAAATAKQLEALDAELAAVLRPVADRPFIVLHDALQYFEKRYGLTAAGSIAVGPDETPSAKRLIDLRTTLKSRGAVCVLTEPGLGTKLAAVLTEGTTARTREIDPEATAIPAGRDAYDTLMRTLAGSLVSCLGDR
jgi:zinc transport system substrate-binding protein